MGAASQTTRQRNVLPSTRFMTVMSNSSFSTCHNIGDDPLLTESKRQRHRMVSLLPMSFLLAPVEPD